MAASEEPSSPAKSDRAASMTSGGLDTTNGVEEDDGEDFEARLRSLDSDRPVSVTSSSPALIRAAKKRTSPVSDTVLSHHSSFLQPFSNRKVRKKIEKCVEHRMNRPCPRSRRQ